MNVIEKVNEKCKRGSIRKTSQYDIQKLMFDLIEEDINYSLEAGFSDHHEMIAYTAVHSSCSFSVLDDESNFCSAFGLVPIEKKDSAIVWFLSCGQFKRHMTKIHFAKDFLDMCNIALDEMSVQFPFIYCNISKNNIFASRRAKLMKFSKSRSLGKVDEYVRSL